MESFLQDIRYSLRTLAKRPGFTITAMLALALGIGANSAIFSVVNAVLLRPLPYKDPERLALIWTRFEPDLPQNWVSGPELLDLRERSKSFEGFGAVSWQQAALTGSGEPEQVQAGIVSANLFSLLGAEPTLGRSFRPEEDLPNSGQAVILSHNFWQRRFGADPKIIGQSILIDGESAAVVGVMPPEFGLLPPDAQSPKSIDIWAPLAADLKQLNRGSHFLRVIARIKPEVSIEQARAEIDIIAKQLDDEYYNFGFGITVAPFLGHIVRDARPALLVLLAAVGFVLLIACVNVANLLLAKAVSREREIAVRLALGAGRSRIIRQLLTESVVLSFMSGAVGLLFALLGLKAIIALVPDNIPRLDQISIDARVLIFTTAISLLTGIVFGLAPAIQSTKPDLNESLKDGGKGASGGGKGRIRSALVVAEIALTLVLLSGAGLMIRSFLMLQRVSPGFNPDNLITMRLRLPQTKYPDGPQIAAFYNQLTEKIKALPGVVSVGAVSRLPLSGSYSSGTVTADAPPSASATTSFEADQRQINSDYFSAMNIPLLKGRAFSDLDRAESVGVAVIDEKFADRFWPNEDPIGKRLKTGGAQSNNPWLTIIGVAGKVKHYGLNEDGREMVYFPISQAPSRSMFIAVRTSGKPLSMATAIRNEVWAIDPSQPVSDIKEMEELVYGSTAQPRFSMLLLGLFAFIAMLLAAVGVYGVMNYSVTQRTREIGIRMALGAQPMDVIKLALGEAISMIGIGLAVGLAASLALTRLMKSLLFGVGPNDPATFLFISLLLIATALAACFIPARRASKIDPMKALRYE